MKIRVLSYNIHGAKGVDGRRNYQRIGNFLKEQQIDVALIQELDTRPKSLSTDEVISQLLTDHFDTFISAPTLKKPEGWFGNAILTRFPVIKKTVIDISAPGKEPRNILEVFMQTPSGYLHVVNTHKGLGYLERGSQMRMLKELLSRKSEVPLVVGGDINEWHAFSKSLKKLNETLHPLRTGPTFPTFFPLFHLDRMWCRPAGVVEKWRILKTEETRLYSDHYPLLAEVLLP